MGAGTCFRIVPGDSKEHLATYRPATKEVPHHSTGGIEGPARGVRLRDDPNNDGGRRGSNQAKTSLSGRRASSYFETVTAVGGVVAFR